MFIDPSTMPMTTLHGGLPHEFSRRTSQARALRRRAILNALPNPVLLIAPDGKIVDANIAAESFFEISTQFLQRQSLKELVPFGSPLLALIEQVRSQRLAGQRIQGRSRHAADRW